MTQSNAKDRRLYEGLITALAFGGFFVTLGLVFGLTPRIGNAFGDFFSDLTSVSYPLFNGTVVLPAPEHPANHPIVYTAIFTFMLYIGILQIVILAARLLAHSTIRHIAETVGNAVFWLGGALAAYVYLMAGTISGWFTFWPSLIVLAGVSLIVQGIILFANWRR